MPIYLRHPTHGTKVASIEMEAQYDEQNGWSRFDPAEETVTEEETVVEETPVEEQTLAELENNAIVKTRKRRTTTPEV